ncbi:MAG: PHB depolymerase family esterase [Lysobacterales bacterium]|jgi:poly(3-hydroxybutyrate) depolymerase
MRYLLLTTLLITGCAVEEEPSTLVLNIDAGRVTASGVSAGAHMAHQLHIAYSDLFSGVGIVSGGPYNCAENSLTTAMSRCMVNTDNPLPIADIAAGIRADAETGKLASTDNLADDRVWMFHGTNDTTISPQVHGATAALYAEFMPAEQIQQVDNIPATHLFPAKGRGTACNEMLPPFVGDCDYDAAGIMLQYLYPGLRAPAGEMTTALREVSLPGAKDAELMETAYLFAPEACVDGGESCALHLVLHGCAMSAEVIGTAFIEQSGYLPWAEANNIVLAFPQVEKSMVAPLNPHGCWDWWGYTGDDYATRSGKQMAVLTDWLDSLSK